MQKKIDFFHSLVFFNICIFLSSVSFIKDKNKRHNIFGLWSVHLVDQLNKDLEIGSRKVERWANDIGVKIINMTYEKQDPFFNINTKEDLEIAEKILDD